MSQKWLFHATSYSCGQESIPGLTARLDPLVVFSNFFLKSFSCHLLLYTDLHFFWNLFVAPAILWQKLIKVEEFHRSINAFYKRYRILKTTISTRVFFSINQSDRRISILNDSLFRYFSWGPLFHGIPMFLNIFNCFLFRFILPLFLFTSFEGRIRPLYHRREHSLILFIEARAVCTCTLSDISHAKCIDTKTNSPFVLIETPKHSVPGVSIAIPIAPATEFKTSPFTVVSSFIIKLMKLSLKKIKWTVHLHVFIYFFQRSFACMSHSFPCKPLYIQNHGTICKG